MCRSDRPTHIIEAGSHPADGTLEFAQRLDCVGNAAAAAAKERVRLGHRIAKASPECITIVAVHRAVDALGIDRAAAAAVHRVPALGTRFVGCDGASAPMF